MISDTNGNGEKKGINKERVGYGHPPKETRIKRGEVRNPNGRPKGTSLTATIRRVLAEPDKKYKTKGDALIAVAERAARKGDFRYFKELIDRNDGKVPDQIIPTGKLVVEIVYRRPNETNADN